MKKIRENAVVNYCLATDNFGLTRKITKIKDFTYGSNDVRDMRYTCSRSCAQVQYFAARHHMDLIHTTQDRGGQLGPKRVPNSVFNFALVSSLCSVFNGNSLLAINSISRNQVQGDQSIFLATGNKYTLVTMRFNYNSFRGSTATTSSATSSWTTATWRSTSISTKSTASTTTSTKAAAATTTSSITTETTSATTTTAEASATSSVSSWSES